MVKFFISILYRIFFFLNRKNFKINLKKKILLDSAQQDESIDKKIQNFFLNKE